MGSPLVPCYRSPLHAASAGGATGQPPQYRVQLPWPQVQRMSPCSVMPHGPFIGREGVDLAGTSTFWHS